MLATENSIETSTLVNNLVAQKIPFALYRLPQSELSEIVIPEGDLVELHEIDFETLPEGFVFAPYKGKPILFRADFFQKFSLLENTIDISELRCNFSIPDTSQSEMGFSLDKDLTDTDRSSYFTDSAEVIKRIKLGEARKVVLSRKKHLGTLRENNFFLAFKKLCSNYPDAMISLVNLPSKSQIWLGATPETLVSQDKNGIFKTMSLAGTQSAKDKTGRDIEPIDALWSHKEIEEQAIVGRYIINCLKTIRVREFEEEGPRTVKAGNLLHLRTTYSIDTNTINFHNLSSIMLNLLHPTPAICGMPKENAERILDDCESYNREFYSGYLGPVNMEKASHLFVNLRTLKIEDNEVYAFAGGGLLEDSDPLKEWEETEIKIKTISKAFSNP